MLRFWLFASNFWHAPHVKLWTFASSFWHGTKIGYPNMGWLSSKRPKSASPKTPLILAHAVDILEEIQYLVSLGKTWWIRALSSDVARKDHTITAFSWQRQFRQETTTLVCSVKFQVPVLENISLYFIVQIWYGQIFKTSTNPQNLGDPMTTKRMINRARSLGCRSREAECLVHPQKKGAKRWLGGQFCGKKWNATNKKNGIEHEYLKNVIILLRKNSMK